MTSLSRTDRNCRSDSGRCRPFRQTSRPSIHAQRKAFLRSRVSGQRVVSRTRKFRSETFVSRNQSHQLHSATQFSLYVRLLKLERRDESGYLQRIFGLFCRWNTYHLLDCIHLDASTYPDGVRTFPAHCPAVDEVLQKGRDLGMNVMRTWAFHEYVTCNQNSFQERGLKRPVYYSENWT